jgi:hypothetical protein
MEQMEISLCCILCLFSFVLGVENKFEAPFGCVVALFFCEDVIQALVFFLVFDAHISGLVEYMLCGCLFC